MPRAAWSASARTGRCKKIAVSQRVLAISLFRMFFVIANFLAASAARQGAQGRPRHRRPFPFLPKGDCVPLGTLPEKRENAKRKQTDKPKFKTFYNRQSMGNERGHRRYGVPWFGLPERITNPALAWRGQEAPPKTCVADFLPGASTQALVLTSRPNKKTPTKGTCDRAGSLQTLLIGLDARMNCSKIKI